MQTNCNLSLFTNFDNLCTLGESREENTLSTVGMFNTVGGTSRAKKHVGGYFLRTVQYDQSSRGDSSDSMIHVGDFMRTVGFSAMGFAMKNNSLHQCLSTHSS